MAGERRADLVKEDRQPAADPVEGGDQRKADRGSEDRVFSGSDRPAVGDEAHCQKLRSQKRHRGIESRTFNLKQAKNESRTFIDWRPSRQLLFLIFGLELDVLLFLLPFMILLIVAIVVNGARRHPPAAAKAPARPAVLLPDYVAFVDVETTGLTRDDRVITLGAIVLDTRSMNGATLNVSVTHLIFNPGRLSHPMARRVHGYTDNELEQQEPFSERAAEISQFLSPAALIVAHNAQFDMSFINRELELCEAQPLRVKTYCTMLGCRERFPGEPAGLAAAAARVGAFRLSSKYHGALEDAWLSMLVFLALHDIGARPSFLNVPCHTPENWRGAPRQVMPTTARRRGRPRKAA
jgi:DNA polymerase-3 subunit epsilon